MKNTGFWSSADAVPNIALGYTRLSAGPPSISLRERTVSVLNAPRGTSAGGSYSTVRDLERFSAGLRTRQLLKSDSLQLLFSGGYGLLGRSMNNVRYVGHGGGAPGAMLILRSIPTMGTSWLHSPTTTHQPLRFFPSGFVKRLLARQCLKQSICPTVSWSSS